MGVLPSKSTWLLCPITINGAHDRAHLMVEEEQCSDDCAGQNCGQGPAKRQGPEFHNEVRSIETRGSKRSAHVECRFVKLCQFTNVPQCNEDDNSDGSCMFRETQTDISVKQWLPVLGC